MVSNYYNVLEKRLKFSIQLRITTERDSYFEYQIVEYNYIIK